MSYSGGTTARNFTLGQTLYNYDFFNRATTTDANGEPRALDAVGGRGCCRRRCSTSSRPTTRSNGRRIYVNGVFTDDADPVAGRPLTDWDDTFALVLGNEVSRRPHSGRASCAWSRSTTAR